MGAWYPGNWPWLVSFWQQRLFFAATNTQPSRIDGSQVNDFTNFAPSLSDGTVVDSVRGVVDHRRRPGQRRPLAGGGRLVAHAAACHRQRRRRAGRPGRRLGPGADADLGAGLPRDQHRRARLFDGIARQQGGDLRVYGGRKLYEWAFNWQSDGYIGADKSVESEHLTRSGLVDIAYQKRPFSIIWGIRADGNLVGLTYLPEQSVQGWHQHRLGGNYYGGNPIVESIACIPAQDNSYDELWMVVKRTVNGAVIRTVEVMAKFFDDQPQGQAVYMDLAVQSDHSFPAGTLTASATTKSTSAGLVPITFTVTGATPFAPGNVDSIIHYNGGTAIVTGFVSTTALTGIWYISPTNLKPAAPGDWSLTPQNDTYSGLGHLEGEEVLILGDGADFGLETVVGGSVTLDPSRGQASSATVGLPIPYRLVSMPWAPKQAADAQGHYKTVAMIYLRLYDSLGCNFGRQITDEYTGQKSEELDTLPTRNTLDLLGVPPPLQSGIYRLPMPGGHDQEGQIVVEGSGPYPTTVLAVLATADVGELPGGG